MEWFFATTYAIRRNTPIVVAKNSYPIGAGFQDFLPWS